MCLSLKPLMRLNIHFTLMRQNNSIMEINSDVNFHQPACSFDTSLCVGARAMECNTLTFCAALAWAKKHLDLSQYLYLFHFFRLNLAK